MDILILVIIFLASSVVLYFSSEEIIKGLVRLSKFWGVTEFVLSFFIIAFAASIPNLFVGITSALRGIPELSFGDVLGNNIVALTIGIGLATFFAPKKEIPAENRTISTTAIFTLIASLLPVLLIYDGVLDRIDGVILIMFFAYYIYWLFSKKERFSKVYEEHKMEVAKETKLVFIDLSRIIIGFIFLLVAAQGIVYTASEFAVELGLPLVVIGVLILGLGSGLPESFFAISSARKNETGIILGNLMGAVIIPATLILGVVSLISPIYSENFGLFTINRLFVILATITFFISVKSQQKVNKWEASLLLVIYLAFVITTLFFY